MRHDRLEQRRQVAGADVACPPDIAVASRREQDGEVELLVVGLERHEQVEDLVEDLLRTGIRAVDLVDDDNGAKAERERLAGDELGLRHRPLSRVDQQDHAVDHRQDALDLAAEIGVAGRVDDVDVRRLRRGRVGPFDRRALGEDSDATLALEVVRVHRPLGNALVVAEGAGLAKHLVDERRLAVVDVRDDRNIAQAHGG